MKICLINSMFTPDERGGAERMVSHQAQELRALGHKVVVITTKGLRGKKYKEVIDGVFIYRVKSYNITSFSKYSSMSLPLRLLWLFLDIINYPVARQVRDILEVEKPDRVITHNLRGLSYLVPRQISKLGLCHYHTLHDIQLVYPSGLLIKGGRNELYQENKFYNNFFLRSWYEKVSKFLLGSPDKVYSSSQWLMDFHVRRGFFDKSKKVIKYPMMMAGVKVKNINNKLDLKLLYVGQVEESKGILFLINSLKSCDDLKFHLDVVGNGSKLNKAKELVVGDSRFIFHDRKPHKELVRYYSQADITIVPSLTYENAPTVIFESVSCGTPVLASQIGGIPEFVKEGKTGFLFDPGNEKDFHKKIKNLVSS